MPFKVMLAGKFDPKKQKYPAYASPKIDGIRVRGEDGEPVARSNKLIPNEHIQRIFRHHGTALEGIDAEIIVGEPVSDGKMYPVWDAELKQMVDRLDDPYNRTSGATRRRDGKPDFSLYVFDLIDEEKPFFERLALLKKRNFPDFVKVVPQVVINNYEELCAYEEKCLLEGYEGVMVRAPSAKYKQGRSTTLEGGLLKVKRLTTDEAVIVGFEEEMENLNEAVTNELGHTARSSHKENKRGKGRLGAIVARVLTGRFEGVTVHVGTGYTAAQREAYWNVREDLMGAPFTFTHFLVGAKDAPRFPVFQNFRDDFDMDEEVNDAVAKIRDRIDAEAEVAKRKEQLSEAEENLKGLS